MSREWKPGDVAIAKYEGCEPRPFFRRLNQGGEGEWVSAEGTRSTAFEMAKWVRPLVVIDPEDREQVERVIAAYEAAYNDRKGYGHTKLAVTDGIDDLQAALRSLIIPPRPPEPTGLGAVVEDAEGRRWMRVCEHASPCNAWSPVMPDGAGRASGVGNPDATDDGRTQYDLIAAAKVLSEGWSE